MHVRELNLENWQEASGHVHDHSHQHDFSTLAELEHLSLRGSSQAMFPLLPPTIQTLNLLGWHSCSVADGTSLGSMKLEKLTRLSIGDVHGFTFDDLCLLLEANKGNLIELDCASPTWETTENLENMKRLVTSGYLCRVEKLTMPRCQVNDEIAEALAANAQCVLSLDISHSFVSGIGVRALVEKPGSKLQRLQLNFCDLVSVDAVDYARSLGIQVEFRFLHDKGWRVRDY